MAWSEQDAQNAAQDDSRSVQVSRYSDLSRPPLSELALRRALIVDGGVITQLRYLTTTESTNADVATAARAGEAEGLVIVADEQTAGRGRLDRQWRSPRGAGLAVSFLLRPGDTVEARGWSPVPSSRYAWLPLLAGVALVEMVQRLGAVDAVLKWPNDLLIEDRKCAGILAETVAGSSGTAPAVVIGIGLNVTLREHELPRPDVTSLQLSSAACIDRDPLLRALVRSLASWYARWRDAGGDPVASGLLDAYRGYCSTIGREVRVELPGGQDLAGVASAVDAEGHLVVAGQSIAAGDVIHVRAKSPQSPD